MFEASYLGVVFFTSLLLALLLTPLAQIYAEACGLVDVPGRRKMHSCPMPRVGGVAIAGAFCATVLLSVQCNALVGGVLAGALAISFTGILDDKYQIRPRWKFAGEILAVVLFMAVSGIALTHLGNLFALGRIELGSWAWPVTLFAVVGVINALNLSDGLDGLAGGISLIGAAFLAFLAYEAGQWFVLTLLVVLLGSILGFLRFNQHPATLFMGDTGSLLLGYVLAVLAVALTQGGSGGEAVAPITVLLTLCLPVADTLWVMGRRMQKGTSPFLPDKAHLHHRLLALGLSHGTTVSVIYALCGGFGALAWLARELPESGQLALGATALAGLYAGVGAAERHGWRASRLPRTPMRWRRYRVVAWVGQSVRWVRPVFLILLLAPALFLLPDNHGPMGLVALGGAVFVLSTYPWRAGRERMAVACGVLFLACFCLLLLYHFHPGFPGWGDAYLQTLAVSAFAWCVLRVLYKRQDQILLPSSFELLLIGVAWFVPLILGQLLAFGPGIQKRLMLACVQTVPFLGVLKLSMYRHARRNKPMAVAFVLIFSLIALSGLVL